MKIIKDFAASPSLARSGNFAMTQKKHAITESRQSYISVSA